jgi:DNA-binding transcriptional MerR regulator
VSLVVSKGPDAFRTISEVAEDLDLPQHVLRFWETRFPQIRPLKRGGGRRYYRVEDVLLVKGIRHLLYDQGFTIKGVQKILKDNGPRHVMALASGDAQLDALPPPNEPEVEGQAAPVEQADEEFTPRSGLALSGDARDRLSGVMRDLLECKRLLERARE